MPKVGLLYGREHAFLPTIAAMAVGRIGNAVGACHRMGRDGGHDGVERRPGEGGRFAVILGRDSPTVPARRA